MLEITETIYRRFVEHPEVSTDSRNIVPGSLFFALKGDNFNGNDYAMSALEHGALLAVVDDVKYIDIPGCIVVSDVLETLQEMAAHHRKQFAVPVVAITGTNGKTTTKELIHAVLSIKYNTLATSGNLNNHIGVPLTLLKITRETQIAVVEMGANHPGEIDFLCHTADPDYGIITNIGKAHLEGFGSYEGVIGAKTELYRYLKQKGGTVFVNTTDTVLMEQSKGITSCSYGPPPATVAAGETIADPYTRITMTFANGRTESVHSNLYGLYNAPNMMAAACIGDFFGVPVTQIKEAIENYRPANNRSQIKETGRNTLILDAYNANPSSMAAALKSFSDLAYPDKTVILGDMLELGSATDDEHLQILSLLDQSAFQHVYLVGPTFTRLNTRRENTCFQDSDLARMWFVHHQMEHTTALIKGSRGIRLEKLYDLF